MFDKIQSFLEKFITPITVKMSNNKTISAISTSMISLMPVLIGSAVFSLLANFPISAVTNFLNSIGIGATLASFVTIMNNLNPILFAVVIAYNYTKKEGLDGLPAGVFALVVYFALIPETVKIGEQTITAFTSDYLGGNGIFVALISSIIVAKLYCFITKKNIVLKLPDSVPPMIAKSFEPIFAGCIIFGVFIILRHVCGLTSYGNIFNIVIHYIQKPIVAVGANIPAMIIFYTIVNLFWFFGIHPSAMLSLFTPVLITMMTTNIGAIMSGSPAPYVAEYLVYLSASIGGTGSTLGLAIVILLFAKSERYKSMRKIGSIPGLFNVNEPMIFGMPIMLNPNFLIPMLLAPSVGMVCMFIATKLIPINFNALAAAAMPWTMPYPIVMLVAGGLPLLLISLVIVLLIGILYFPFFKSADMKEYKEEQLVK